MRTLLLLPGLLGVGAFPSAARAQCAGALGPEVLEQHAQAVADAAFVTGDAEAFEQGLDSLLDQLPCVRGFIPAETVARVHLALALEALAANHSAEVLPQVHAAVVADPAFTLNDAQALPGSPLREALVQARALGPGPQIDLEVPICASVWVAGVPIWSWPTTRPVLAQLMGPDGEVQWTRLYAVGDPPPDLSEVCARPAPLAAASPGAKPTRARAGAGPLVWGAGAAGLAAGALTVVSASAYLPLQRSYRAIAAGEDVALDPAAIEDTLPRRANTFASLAVGTGVVALGLGLTWVVRF